MTCLYFREKMPDKPGIGQSAARLLAEQKRKDRKKRDATVGCGISNRDWWRATAGTGRIKPIRRDPAEEEKQVGEPCGK